MDSQYIIISMASLRVYGPFADIESATQGAKIENKRIADHPSSWLWELRQDSPPKYHGRLSRRFGTSEFYWDTSREPDDF
jgi:hypothetical protein